MKLFIKMSSYGLAFWLGTFFHKRGGSKLIMWDLMVLILAKVAKIIFLYGSGSQIVPSENAYVCLLPQNVLPFFITSRYLTHFEGWMTRIWPAKWSYIETVDILKFIYSEKLILIEWFCKRAFFLVGLFVYNLSFGGPCQNRNRNKWIQRILNK